MRIYTVHYSKHNTTTVFNSHDFSGFLMEISDEKTGTSSDMKFAVDEYGPQKVADRYFITLHNFNA